MSWAAKLAARIAGGLRQSRVDPQAIRAEVWALGGRHQGRVVEGARAEMRAPGVSPRRALLLRAVVKSQGSKAGASA